MDRLASIQFFASESKVCGKCGMHIKKSHGCCRDEVQIIKLQDDQNKNPIASYTIPSLEAIGTVPSDFIVASFYNIDEKKHFHNHSPPLLSAQDTYLQINVFRI